MNKLKVEKRYFGLRAYYLNNKLVGYYNPVFKSAHGRCYLISDKINFKTFNEFKSYILESENKS